MRVIRWIVWAATGVFWTICVWLTHVAVLPPLPPPIPVYDKARHFLGYGALAGAWYLSYWVWKPQSTRIWLAVLVTSAVYGALDELTQPPFGRTCDFYDWLADMGGTATAIVAMTLISLAAARLISPKTVRTVDAT